MSNNRYILYPQKLTFFFTLNLSVTFRYDNFLSFPNIYNANCLMFYISLFLVPADQTFLELFFIFSV